MQEEFQAGKIASWKACDQGNLGYSRNEKCPMGWKPKSAEGIPGKRHQRRT